MENKENILEQIRKEREELKRFQEEIAELIKAIKNDQDYTPQKCALSIQEVKKKLRECSEKKGGGGSVYDNHFSRPKQEKKDEDEEVLRKKKLDASKKSGGYKPQM